MAKLYNLARMTTATTGTGTITLGSAVASYVTFANAGVQNSDTVTYAIVDGNNREVGRGVYTSSGTTLTRATILESTNGNLAINLSGNAEVFITAAAEDITSNVEITGGSITGITDLAIADGGTGQSTASAAANALDGYLTIVSAAGTTTLTNTSARNIVVTGTNTQTIVLPVVSTLALGWSFIVSNTSTGAVTFQSSGLNAFPNTLPANMAARFVCVAITGTGTASWNFVYIGSTGRTGAGSLVFGTNPTFTTSILTPLASGGTAASSTLTLQSTTGAGTTDAIIFNTGSQSERMRITTAGSVGIGTATTSSRLEVLGGVANSITALGTEDVATVTITNSDVSGIGRLTKTLYQVGNLSLAAVGAVYSAFNAGGDIGGDLVFGTQTNLAGGVVERLRISKDGAFGIAGSNYGSSGQFIKSAGSAAAPSWASIANTDVSGLGTMSTQNANSVSISGGSITGITDLAVADGGTGASTLTGYVKGSGTAALTASATIPNTDITGLGTMSTQAASSVAITGGSITGITDLAVADGGTGASSFTAYSVVLGGTTSTGPLQNVSGVGTSGQVLTSAGAGAAPTWSAPAAGSGSLIRAPQILTSGTSYTTPAGCTAIYVEAVGGGAAGAAGGTSTTGYGGGSGAYAAKYFTVTASTAYTYAIGAGGTGSNGAAGGNTTFTVGATTVTAGGGSASTGGTATNGDANIRGGNATNGGSATDGPGSAGASSFFGGGGGGGRGDSTAGGTGQPGTDGVAGGGGGGGGSATGSGSTDGARGNGGAGLIRITEYR